MSNLQTHIASLEALITKANALPTEKKIQETKTVSPSTSSQTVQPDSGYDGLGKVTINAMPTGSVGTPSINIDANGKITATAAVDAGYVDGTDKTGTKTMTTQAAKTVTPTKSSQTAVAKNVYTTGVVTVGAIPDKYQDVSGVTATEYSVLTSSQFVDSSGELKTGAFDTSKIIFKDPSGNISYVEGVLMAPSDGFMYPYVPYNVSGTTTADKVLDGAPYISMYGKQTGTMPNNGTLSSTIDGLETKSVSIPKGYTDGGTVALDSTIDDTADSQAAQIAEIAALLEGKSAGGSGGTDVGWTYGVVPATETEFYDKLDGLYYYYDLDFSSIISGKHVVFLHGSSSPGNISKEDIYNNHQYGFILINNGQLESYNDVIDLSHDFHNVVSHTPRGNKYHIVSTTSIVNTGLEFIYFAI